MRVIVCLLIVLSCWKPARAQSPYFVYLESEGGQPFYVRIEDRIFSSVAPGYLILSEMGDSTYQFYVGFSTGRKAARFSIPVGARDRGFRIRSTNGEIRMTDLHTSGAVAPTPDPFADLTYTVRNDPFTVLLSRAAGDSDILYVPIPVASNSVAVRNPATSGPPPTTEAAKTETETPKNISFGDSLRMTGSVTSGLPQSTRDSIPVEARSVDSLAVAVNQPPVDTLAQRPAPSSDTISSRTSSLSSDTLSGRTAAAVSVTNRDSTAVVPATVDTAVTDKPSLAGNSGVVASTGGIPDSTTRSTADSVAAPPVFQRTRVRKYAESSTSEGFGLVYIDQTPEGPDTIRLIIPNPPFNIQKPDTVKGDDPQFFLERKPVAPPSLDAGGTYRRPAADCPAQASDNDFFRLRRTMAGRTTDEGMVDEARKYFKRLCFTTAQLRNLSALFLTDAGKYLFFDAAYLHVSDGERFAELASEIRDPYYTKRFKALIGD